MTPEQTADITEICQLKHAYAWAYDTQDLDGLVALFTDDGVCEFGPYGTWTGADELRAGFQGAMAMTPGRFPGIHAVTNPLIEVDGDEANGRWYLLDQFFGAAGEATLRLIAVYHERYRRRPVGWRIAHSSIDFLWSMDEGRIEGEMADTPAPPPGA